MIEIYTYYSVGGYKDLYVGNTEDKCDSVYYSPLLPLWQSGERFDNKTNSQLKSLSELPQMEFITNDSKHNLPKATFALETRGGYKCILTKVGMAYSLVVREIENEATDGFGRKIPFLLQFIGKDFKEMQTLGRYVCENIREFEEAARQLLHYNPEMNALEAELGKLNEELNRILVTYRNKCEDSATNIAQKKVTYMLMTDTFHYKSVLNTLGFGFCDIYKVYGYDGKSFIPAHSSTTDSEKLSYGQTADKTTSSEYNHQGSSTIEVSHDTYRSNPFQDYAKAGCLQIIIESIRNLLSKYIKLTPDDNDDITAIKQHIKNIINRKR